MVPLSVPTSASADTSARSRREAALGHVQPFGLDICPTWHDATEESSVPLHERALEEMHVLESEGRVVLLSAPRAGHGKTHLLGRVAQKLSNEAVVAGLPWQALDGVSWMGCGRGVLQDLASGVAQPNALQRMCGGVLATLLRRLIQTGRIPSTDPVQALRVLSQDPMDLFNEGGNAKVIGEWFRRHFEQLRRPLAEISNLDSLEPVEDWLGGFFSYVNEASPSSFSALVAKMEKNGAQQVSRFFRLATIWRPLVLVADHMDGLYRDVEAGVAVARMTLALASVPGVHVVLSVNQDLWDTTFGRQLPSALEDRLNARNIALRGLTEQDARALITMRLRDAGVGAGDLADFLRFLDLDRFFLGRAVGSVSARGLLRHAAQMWWHWLRSDEATPQTSGSSTEQPVVPSEGFLLDPPVAQPAAPASPPMPAPMPLIAEETGEDMQKLAANLAADAGGRVVHLAEPPSPTAPVSTVPAPSVAPVAPPTPVAPAVAQITPPVEPPSAPVELTSPVPAAPPVPAPPVVSFDKPALSLVPPPPAEPPAPQPPAPPPQPPPPRQPALTEVPPTTFHKLRQMLAKLKVATDSVPLSDAALTGQEAAHAGVNGTRSPGPGVSSDVQARYEKFRHDIASTSRPSLVDLPVISDLVRLAGKRFPVVNYDEVELPGLLGRSLPRWSLQGMELIFGLEDFSDNRYWKTVSSYMAGRLAEIHAGAGHGPHASPNLKLVVFKGDTEAAGLVSLLRDETIPPSLRSIVDAVHLDPRSLASLYAMHQLVREAETGAMQADATAVLSTLANELDFFWKRVTRPKA